MHTADRRPRGRTVPGLALGLIALALVAFVFVAPLPASAAASTDAADLQAPGTTTLPTPGDAESSVAAVDQSPIVSVAVRRDTNAMTVPLMLLGTAAMLVLGFGMLAVRCVRSGPDAS